MPGSDDHALAAEAASSAGAMLSELRVDLFSGAKAYSGWPEEHGDEEGHDFLVELLQRQRPGDGILSEEGSDGRDRHDFDRVWIVDPLDGSSDYGRGSGDYAVHVALTKHGKGVAAAVSLPEVGVVLGTHLPPVVPEATPGPPVVITGRSRVHNDGQIVAHALDAKLMTCGSAGVKAMLVVMGQADVYIHNSPLYEWDVCAPAIVAKAAGLHVSAADGSDFVYNQVRPIVRGLLVCRPEYADTVIGSLGY